MYKFRKVSTVFLIALIAFLSCKKDKDPAPIPPPEEETTLSLIYEKRDGISLKRERIESTTQGDYFYAVGGQNPEEYNKYLYIYNSKDTKWKLVPLSIPRNESKILGLNGKIFVAGGWHATSDAVRIDIYDQQLNKITVKLIGDQSYGHIANVASIANRYAVFLNYNYFHIYDDQLKSWETIELEPQFQIIPSSVVVVGKILYIMDVNTPSFIWTFNIDTRSFGKITSNADLANGRMVAKDNFIYFYGNSIAQRTDIIDLFDTQTNTWDQIHMPAVRDFYTLNIDKSSNNLIISGGRIENEDGSMVSVSDDLLVYNTITKLWADFKLKTPRIFHASEILNKELIIFGGLNNFYIENSPKIESEIYSIKYSK